MPTIGSLTAVFDADPSKFDAGLKHVDAGLKQTESQAKKTGTSLDNALKAPSKSLTDLGSSINTMLGGRLSSLTTGVSSLSTSVTGLGTATAATGVELGALAGPIGLGVAALVAEVGAVVALADGLFELAKSAAEVQGKLYDMSQQTGVSVETLSALDELAKTTGGTLAGVVASLGIFQKNLDSVADATSKSSKALKELNVNTSNTEEALRQTLTALSKMTEGSHQTALALEVFGRGGKQMLAILKESHGDIDETVRKLQSMGLANTAASQKADELNDALVHLDTQLMGLKVTVGNQVIPVVLAALKDLEKTINNNKEAIKALGFVANVAANALSGQLKLALFEINLFLKGNEPLVRIMVGLYERLAAAMQLVRGRIPNVDPNAIGPIDTTGSKSSGLDLLKEAASFGLPVSEKVDLSKIPGLVKKEGKKAAADPGLQILKQLQTELRGLQDLTKAQTVAEELLDDKYKKINPSLKEQILLYAQLIDTKRSTIDVEAKIKQLNDDQAQALRDQTDAVNDYIFAQEKALKPLSLLDEANKFIGESFLKTGVAIDKVTQFLIRLNAMALQSKKNMDGLREAIDRVGELTPNIGSTGVPDFDPKNVLSPADQAKIGVPPPGVDPEWVRDVREKMRSLSFELTDIFNNSVRDGFEGGVKSGLKTLELGLLRIVQDIFLRKIADGLSQILGDMATGAGGSGGGFWSGLFKTILGAVVGGAAGGIGGGAGGSGGSVPTGGNSGPVGSGIGNFATGGFIPPGKWGWTGEEGPERVFGGRTGVSVIPTNKGGPQVVNHITQVINLPQGPKGGYVSPKSARQQAELIMSHLQGST